MFYTPYAGVPTQMIGCVGTDSYGTQYLHQLKSMGVESESVTQVEGIYGVWSWCLSMVYGMGLLLPNSYSTPYTF
ncbi:hypothetical protein EON63_13115 [archaeon]|nr:MAG: hypothetical protein EON63_13115 [archaeon]